MSKRGRELYHFVFLTLFFVLFCFFQGKDDETGEPLTQREDDKVWTVYCSTNVALFLKFLYTRAITTSLFPGPFPYPAPPSEERAG